MIGDCLLYVYPSRDTSLDIDPVFAEMPVWRFTASALLGVIGMGFMLFGFQSLYAMTKSVCGREMQVFGLLGGVGRRAQRLHISIWERCCPLRIRAYLTAAEAFSLPRAPAK